MTDRDPDDTTPSTHQPYGQEPPTSPPYGQDPYAQQGYPPPPQPPYGQGYGQGYAQPHGQAATIHPSANTALVLGIVALAGGMLCGLPLLVGPFAWFTGRKVKREIEAAPQHYTGASEANAGMILGIVATVLLALALVAVALFSVLLVVGASTS